MEFKGTKGKWMVSDTIISCNNVPLASAFTLTSRVDESRLTDESWLDMRKRTELLRIECQVEQKSNALLISKAPEMLEMLEYFVEKDMLSAYGEALANQLIKEATELETIEEIEPLNIKEIKPIIDSCAFLLDKIENLNNQIETMQKLNKDKFPFPYTEQEIQKAITERDEFMLKLGSCISGL